MAKHLKLETYVSAVRQQGGIYTVLPVTLAGTAANLTVGGTLSVTGATTLSGAINVTSTSANAFTVGANGTTNPVLKVDASTASVATGVSITGAAAGSRAAISVISSGTNEGLSIDAKGTGQLLLNALVSGTTGAQIGGSANVSSTVLTVKSSNASAFAVGLNGATNPALQVDASTASSATGIQVKSAAAAAGVAIATISSGTDENLAIAAKGAGTVTFNPAVTATAGGASNDGIKFGSLGVGLFTGTGAPTFSAMNGSIYVDSNATTTTTRIYVNKSGAGTAGTTWTNLTTAA